MLETTDAESVRENARDLLTLFAEFCVYMNSRRLKKEGKNERAYGIK